MNPNYIPHVSNYYEPSRPTSSGTASAFALGIPAKNSRASPIGVQHASLGSASYAKGLTSTSSSSQAQPSFGHSRSPGSNIFKYDSKPTAATVTATATAAVPAFNLNLDFSSSDNFMNGGVGVPQVKAEYPPLSADTSVAKAKSSKSSLGPVRSKKFGSPASSSSGDSPTSSR